MAKLYAEYALSFGVQQYEGLWKIQYLHPEDAGMKVQAWLPMDPEDERIGEEVDDIQVAEPGVRLVEVMGWLYDRITRYPYYWPKEGGHVSRFGYDFEVEVDGHTTSHVEITELAYDILKDELRIQPPAPNAWNDIDIQYDTVSSAGVLIKLSLTLEHAQPVSEFSLAPFTKYPLQLLSLSYEEDTESFHPKKEIAIGQTSAVSMQQTTQSIRVQFPSLIAKRVTVILGQKNHEKNTYNVNQDKVNKAQLWESISQRETEVTLNAADGLETVGQGELDKLTGWDIYLRSLAAFKKDLSKWEKDMLAYRQKEAERQRKLNEATMENKRFASAQSEYRAEYNKAVQKYKTRVVQYQQNLENYNAAYQKYQRDLKVYNKYLRDHADWKSKWG